MSVFEAISIQGIRSFDPNKAQILEFLKPVTIILGQNGSGKTTIIESLKYATTGDLPPGSKIGGSFVHDPKLAQESEVKGKISLEIKDIKGNSLTVSRSLQATQKDKNKQVTQKTLDSSIKRVLSNGETVSISSKCADINLEMTNSLGVSKAVLENVIFCHQEESNWPLMEAKQVKERFDELFASSRYVKALESIRKTKAQKETDIKQYKTELKYLKVNRDEAEKKISEKKNLDIKITDYSIKIEDLKKKLEPTESSIRDFQSQISQFNKVENDLNVKINEKNSNEKRIKELSENISEPLNFTIDELETMINDSGCELQRMKTEINDIDRQIVELKSETSKIHAKNNNFLVEKGGLNTKIENYKSRQGRFFKRLEHISSELQVEYIQSSATHTIKNLQDHVNNEEDILTGKLDIADEEIKSKQNILDNKIKEKTKLEHDIEMSRTTLKKKQMELKSMEKRIKDIGEDSDKLVTIEKELLILKEELEIFKENFNSNQIQEEIKNNSSDIINNEENLNETDKELSRILKFDVMFNQINSLKQQINDKSSQAKILRSRHMENLDTLFDNAIPKSNIKKQLIEKLAIWGRQREKCHGTLITLQSQLASLNVEDRQLRAKIEEKKEIVKKFEEKVYTSCGDSEFEQSFEILKKRKLDHQEIEFVDDNSKLKHYLLKLKKKKADLEEDISTVQGNVSLYKKFQRMLITSGSDCPLCHRDFCNEKEAANLLEEINDKINFAPDLDKKSKELAVITIQFEELLQLDSQSKEIYNLKDSVINNLEKEAQEKRNDICKIKSTIEETFKEQESCKVFETIGNRIQGDVALMEKLFEDVREFERSLGILEEQMTMTYDEFRDKVSALQLQKNTLRDILLNKKTTLNCLRSSYEKSINKENDLKTKMNNLERTKLEIKEGKQEWSSLCSKKVEQKAEIDLIEKNIQSSLSSLEPVFSDLSLLKNDLNNHKEKRKVTEIESREKINSLKIQLRDLEATLKDIKKFENENVQELLNDLERKIAKNNNDIMRNNDIISEKESTIENYKSIIGNNKIKNREMVDTVSIRHCQSQIEQLEVEINEFVKQLGGANISKIQADLVKLENNRAILKKELDEIIFRKNQADNQVTYIEQELKERYSQAEPDFLSMLSKMKVVEITVSDLEKYYKALDQAIMHHHKTKMTEINKILKELWTNTYSSKDIDYVEICSDEESSSAGSKRRNYNYRVVMIKSGIRLDMRGRCSAGQKVLASLLIRLALAEVFCLHCGVLSLDEPTTNLDQENIEHLAYALVKIIKTRSKQKNFQLILITHDEEFLQLLSRSDFVEEFYKINCNNNGHSEIHKTRIDHR